MDCLAAPERLVPPPTHGAAKDDEMTSLGPATIHILSGLRQAFADGPLQMSAPELAFEAGAGSARSGAAGATGSADAAGGTSGRDCTHRTRKCQGSDSAGCPPTMPALPPARPEAASQGALPADGCGPRIAQSAPQDRLCPRTRRMVGHRARPLGERGGGLRRRPRRPAVLGFSRRGGQSGPAGLLRSPSDPRLLGTADHGQPC